MLCVAEEHPGRSKQTWHRLAGTALISHTVSHCTPLLIALHQVCCVLQRDIRAGQADLAQACRQSLAHGVLLALRYLTPLVPWQLAAASGEQLAGTQAFLKGLLQLLHQATELALPFLANPQDSNIGMACRLATQFDSFACTHLLLDLAGCTCSVINAWPRYLCLLKRISDCHK